MTNAKNTVVFLAIAFTIISSGLQAKSHKSKHAKGQWYKNPAMMKLNDCDLVGLAYTTYTTDVEAALPAGYSLWDWTGTTYVPHTDELTTVVVDFFQCSDVEVGPDHSIGLATTYHEILDPRVKTPSGEFRMFGFPMTNNNRLGKFGFKQVGIPSFSAKELVAEFDILEEFSDGNIIGTGIGYADNPKPFGPDIMIRFEWECTQSGTWVEGEAGAHHQHHAWDQNGRYIRAMNWTATADFPIYECAPPDGEDFPLEVSGEFTFPVVDYLPRVITADGMDAVVSEEPVQ